MTPTGLLFCAGLLRTVRQYRAFGLRTFAHRTFISLGLGLSPESELAQSTFLPNERNAAQSVRRITGFTSRKVAGSNPFGRTMALASTQPLTGMSTRNPPGGKRRAARKANNLTAICEPTAYKMWEPRRLTTLLPSTACYRDSFTLRI
jgi:hypothetical protein